MNKFKVCPICKTINLPSVLECKECGNDLVEVSVVDETLLAEAKNTNVISDNTQTNNMVKICDCGAENGVSARKCSVCGEDISDIIPTAKRETSQLKTYLLSSFDNVVKLSLQYPCDIIVGRENELSDYLKSKTFVSRQHARFTVTEDGLFIQNLSKSNGTYLNNEKIDDSIAYKLCIGDKIGLGGNENASGRQDAAAYFVIKGA